MKILIGCPTYFKYEHCLKEYYDAIKKLEFKDFDLVLIDNSYDNTYFDKIKKLGIRVIKGPFVDSAKERIVLSREILRKICLDEGYDYFFSLEQDVIVKPDTITKLLFHKKDIISAYYGNNTQLNLKDATTGLVRKVIINIPLIYLRTRPGFIKRANAKDIINKGVLEVGATGVGCLLISRKVLEKISFKMNPGNGFDDVLFCQDAQAEGFKVYVDGNIFLEHRHINWDKLGVK